jgi:CheY-like chemotaxis protein
MTADEAADPQTFSVDCHACKESYDALQAAFCWCIVSERTLVCPRCETCSCAAPPAYKRRFWTGAPPKLWERKRREHRKREDEPENPAPEDAKRPLVLLVDDEPDIRRVAALSIEALGYGLVTARNGEEGLALARRYRPDLVLTDALMPKLDGRDMCKQIKQDPELAGTKVVVMTSLYSGVKYENQGYLNYGVDGYLVKPLEFERLRSTLAAHLV